MRVFLLITVILFGFNSSAQKKIDCSLQTKEYQEYLKVNKYNEAFTPWEFVKDKCPKQSETVYTNGVNIIQYKIDVASSPEDKEKLARDLMKLYDQFYKNFPQKSQDFEIKKAQILIANVPNTEDEVLNLLNSGFEKASDKVNDAQIIFTYFKLYNSKFKSGDKSITIDNVVEKYSNLFGMLTRLKVSNKEKYDEYDAALRSLKYEGRSVITCDNLSQYFNKNLDVNTNKDQWITNATEVLYSKCSSEPVFLTYAEKFYAIKATTKSSNYLAFASLRNRKFDDAKKYYEESANLENDSIEKANIYYMIALTLYSNDMLKSKETLQKALIFNPKLGKAQLYLAQVYASVAEKCGKTEFEKKAIYFLALQTANKALKQEGKLEATVESLVNDYAPKALTLDDIYAAKMNGKSLKIDCEINEIIHFPSTK